MNITCPNCQKKYIINEAKLPAGIKTAKCKACGRKMPLGNAPAKVSAGQEPVIKVSCQYCGQNHHLRQNKIPPSAKAIKCKSCGRPVPLSRASSSEPVHPLKKEASRLRPDKPSYKVDSRTAAENSLLQFTCTNCGKKYKIGQNKIPPKAVAAKCRACGHNIQLPRTTAIEQSDSIIAAKALQDKVPASKTDSLSQEYSGPASPSGKNKWLFAAAACVLLVVILGALVKFDLIRINTLNQYLTGEVKTTADTTTLLEEEPILALTLNLPEIVDVFETRLEPDQKTAQMQMVMTMMKSLDLREVKLFLYFTQNSQLLPVILLKGSNRQKLEDAFNSQKSFKRYFARKSAGNYRLKEEAISDMQKYELPNEPYQITFMGTGVVLAPVSHSAAIADNPKILSNSTVAKFAQTVTRPRDLATIAIRIPENLNKGLGNNIQNHPAVQAAPQAAFIAGMGAAIVSQLTGSLKPVEMLALGFRFGAQNGRTLSYAQQFRPAVDGEKIFQQLSAADSADTEINGIIRNLIKLFKDQRYQHAINFENNRLALEFSWQEKEDQTFLSALTAATVGQLFAGSMALSPTPGAVDTRYAPEPAIVTAVNTEVIKAQIPQMIKESLFPGNYWNQGETPHMTLDMDTADFPNAAMAELTYEVKSILSPGGKDVFRREESKFKPRIQPGSLFPGNISLSVKKGTPSKDLGKATIFFHLTLPVALEVFDFAAGDPAGHAKETNGIRSSLGRLEKDVAQVNSSGGKSMRLIAYDQTGRALASRESMSTSSSISTRFEGIISTLKVVVTREVLEYPFDIEVDLNRGKELILAREPEIPARMRFNPHPVPTYVNFAPEDLNNLVVNWTEGQDRSWNDSLSIKLPQGPFSGHAV